MASKTQSSLCTHLDGARDMDAPNITVRLCFASVFVDLRRGKDGFDFICWSGGDGSFGQLLSWWRQRRQGDNVLDLICWWRAGGGEGGLWWWWQRWGGDGDDGDVV
ncbi:Hypothetical predicted protein [Olea europaea subsp. europaea]|uniref:Uncharacterized protein n=1 Tax=Olea europaea subsp. europaea TaxID=158383 RepID=A0A8S0UGN6_OLEEU|nr:Hypothetical predicted protein [Olea europaea subsp. europaea]